MVKSRQYNPHPVVFNVYAFCQTLLGWFVVVVSIEDLDEIETLQSSLSPFQYLRILLSALLRNVQATDF